MAHNLFFKIFPKTFFINKDLGVPMKPEQQNQWQHTDLQTVQMAALRPRQD
jgi:hypothetical protein